MKKATVMAAVLTALVGVSVTSLSFAEDTMGKDKGMMMGKKGMMGKGMMGCMMAKDMMGRTVTPTSDGGVVILAGNQLFKYDKGLTLVNKADVPVDMGMMQKDMMGMMKMCPMMKDGMMGSDGASDAVSSEVQSTGAASSDTADHAAHH
jgi:hypothetical protein